MSLLALSALATQLTSGYQAQSFALGGVVATKLLPPLVLGPARGRAGRQVRPARGHGRLRPAAVRALFVSIPLVGSLWWLFVATFLIEICALFWIPAKDAAVPNLLRRPDQVETANQLALVMTYGVSVITRVRACSRCCRAAARCSGASALDTVYVALVLSGVGVPGLARSPCWFAHPGDLRASRRASRGGAGRARADPRRRRVRRAHPADPRAGHRHHRRVRRRRHRRRLRHAVRGEPRRRQRGLRRAVRLGLHRPGARAWARRRGWPAGSRTTGCSARPSSRPGWRWCWWRSRRTCSWRSPR